MDLDYFVSIENIIHSFYQSYGLFAWYDFYLFLFFSVFLYIWIGLDFNRRKVNLLNWIIFCVISGTIINAYGFIILNQILMIYTSFDEDYYNLKYKIFTIRLISAILIYYNIKNRNMKEWAWTLFGFHIPILALPAYFIVRNKKQEVIPTKIVEKQNNTQDNTSKKEIIALCPNCKSPNTKKLSECEYCDANLVIN